MGKEARRNNREKMERGILPIRIGKKEKARDRKKREAQSRIFMPVKKGEAPLSSLEQSEVFARSRKVKEDVASGARSPGPVDLGEADLEPAPPELVNLIADAIFHRPIGRRLRGGAPLVAGAGIGRGETE